MEYNSKLRLSTKVDYYINPDYLSVTMIRALFFAPLLAFIPVTGSYSQDLKGISWLNGSWSGWGTKEAVSFEPGMDERETGSNYKVANVKLTYFSADGRLTLACGNEKIERLLLTEDLNTGLRIESEGKLCSVFIAGDVTNLNRNLFIYQMENKSITISLVYTRQRSTLSCVAVLHKE